MPTLLELAGGAARRASARRSRAAACPAAASCPRLPRDGSVARDYLFFHHEGNRALRMGDWKLVSAREDRDAWELFDLATDRCEQLDLAAQQPDLVRKMEAKWIELEKEYRQCAEEPRP